MAFQIKDFASITASMINWMRASTRAITDFNPGSAARTLVEAPAIEMDQLYQEMFHGLKEAIPVATYRTFEFGREESLPSSGTLTFYTTGGQEETVLVEAGTQAKNPINGVLYATTQDLLIDVGQASGSVPAVALSKGARTNAEPGRINELVGNLPDVVGVANLGRFTLGRDQETPEQWRLRFAAYVQTLNRGTTAAIKYGAQTTVLRDAGGSVVERVAFAEIIEPYEEDSTANNPGFIELYVHNGLGGTSSNLVAEVQRVVDGYYESDGTPVPGWKAAGTVVRAYAASERPVDVEGQIVVLSGFQSVDVVAAAQGAVVSYLAGLSVGEAAVANEIVERVMATPGVYDFIPVAPTANITPVKSEKVMPGTITLTEA